MCIFIYLPVIILTTFSTFISEEANCFSLISMKRRTIWEVNAKGLCCSSTKAVKTGVTQDYNFYVEKTEEQF